VKLTPTEERLFIVLSDGLPHRTEELKECVEDPYSDSFVKHLSNLRRKLREEHMSIVWLNGESVQFYRLMRLVAV
jgi:hypothetical protein